VRIGFEYPDPDTAALFANVVSQAYIDLNLRRALDASRLAMTWLEEQHEVYRTRKYESDEKVHIFKYANDLVGIDDRYNTTVESLSKLQGAWSEAMTERVQVSAVHRKLKVLAEQPEWAPLANHLASENGALRSMLSRHDTLVQEKGRLAIRYGVKHPEMVRVETELTIAVAQIRGAVGDDVSAKKAELDVLANREAALKRELDRAQDQVEGLDGRRIELKFLESEAQRNEDFYKDLDKRLSEVDLGLVLRANNIRIIDSAIPDGIPVRPKLPINLAMSLVLGLFGGCGLAFFMEYLDVTVKTREDIEQVIGVPMLGIVPGVAPEEMRALPNERDRSIFVHARPQSTVAECMRSIRTNVLFRIPKKAAPGQPHPVRKLLITSAAPREGKSFTSCNLSAIIAMTGSRVLLIDADLRRPAVHKRFELSNEIGLGALFRGEISVDDVIVKTHVEGLDCIVAGPPPANPGELLGGGFMKRLLESLTTYDVIIVDSPPVNVVADPLVLANLVDGVLIVVEANRTSRNIVVQAHSRLKEMKANVLGAVVNKLNIQTAGYGYYYYDTYGYYYTEAEQAQDAARNKDIKEQEIG